MNKLLSPMPHVYRKSENIKQNALAKRLYTGDPSSEVS